MQVQSLAKSVVSLLACVFAACAPAANLVIGQVAPMADPESAVARAYSVGMELAFNAVNRSGGVNGNTISLVRGDDGGSPAETVKAATQLLAESKPLLLAGVFGNRNVAELLSSGLLEREKIALVGYRAWAVPADTPGLYNVRAGLREEIGRIVQYLATIGITRLGLLYEGGPQGSTLVSVVQAAAADARAAVVSQAPYARGTTDVHAAVKTLAASSAQAVILLADIEPVTRFIEQYRAAGGSAQLFTHSGIDIDKLSRRLSEGQLQSVAIAQVVPNPYSISTRVAKELNELASQQKQPMPVSFAMMEGFITAKVIVEALRRQGRAPTREGVVATLDAMRAYDVGGYVVGFRPDHHTGSGYVELSIIGRAGRLRQ